MVAQTVTRYLSKESVQRLANLQKSIAGAAPVDILDNATTTITIVFTTSSKAVTIDYGST